MEKKNRCRFLTPLGTGPYSEVTYFWKGRDGAEVVYRTKFAQLAALVQTLLDEEAQCEKVEVTVFCTEKAFEINWADLHAELLNLPAWLKAQGRKTDFVITRLEIPIGQSEEELKQIFNMMYQAIQESDTVYFDVTHGFRTTSIFALTVLNYARATKHIKIGKITYGAYEAGEKDETGKIVRAPIFDLSYLSSILEWTGAAESFLETESSAGSAGSTPLPWFGAPERG